MDTFQRDSLTFDVHDGGPPDGEAIVLLHGFPQDAHSYDRMLPTLHAAGYRTLVPNQRGYSPGARPSGRRAYAGGELAADIVALLDAAGLDSAHIVGHDWGGGVAWGLADGYPDRVRSLTVLSTPHPYAMTRAGGLGQLRKSWYMFAFQLPWIPEAFLGLGIKRGELAKSLEKNGLPRDAALHNQELMSQPGVLTAAINWYRGLPFSLREPVGRITVPTTYVWGNDDSFLGRKAAEATGKSVTADYRFVEVDGDHWLPENQPEQMAELVIERARSAAAVASAS